MLTVPDYAYRSGKGAPICDGPYIVATVNGTSYPTGSACEADYGLARLMAAAPAMRALLEVFINEAAIRNVLPETTRRASRLVRSLGEADYTALAQRERADTYDEELIP